MSLITLGRSRCVICDETLERNQEIVGFPAFTPNLLDEDFFELRRFSDAGVHVDCFDQYPKAERVLEVCGRTRKQLLAGWHTLIFG